MIVTTTDEHGHTYGAVVFPLICPDTGKQCNTLCACYLDACTGEDGQDALARTCTAQDMLNRTEGDPYGRCLKYGVSLQN